MHTEAGTQTSLCLAAGGTAVAWVLLSPRLSDSLVLHAAEPHLAPAVLPSGPSCPPCLAPPRSQLCLLPLPALQDVVPTLSRVAVPAAMPAPVALALTFPSVQTPPSPQPCMPTALLLPGNQGTPPGLPRVGWAASPSADSTAVLQPVTVPCTTLCL